MATIENDRQLEAAMQEFQSLRNAAEGSPEATRRADLDAAIKAYQQADGDRYSMRGRSGLGPGEGEPS